MGARKIFCYVDESGQDTLGDLFVVSVVSVGEERETVRHELENVESWSGKGRVKWHKAKREGRLAYFRAVTGISALHGRLTFGLFRNSRDYPRLTILTLVRTIGHQQGERKAVVFVDGLRRSEYHGFGTELRRSGVKVGKVRGIRSDQADALLRLADAVCGFVREAVTGDPEFTVLFEKVIGEGLLREVGP